jgi:hypothetical protein
MILVRLKKRDEYNRQNKYCRYYYQQFEKCESTLTLHVYIIPLHRLRGVQYSKH